MCTHGQQVSVACVCGGGVSDREVISEVAQHNGLAHLKGHLGARTPGRAHKERGGEGVGRDVQLAVINLVHAQ